MHPSEPVLTGRDLALRLRAAFPDRDWVALLMKKSGLTRDFIEWHLQEEIMPPEPIMRAAGDVLAERR